MNNFRVGHKVVCVDASQPQHIHCRNNGLVAGHVYTIAATGLLHPHDPERLPCVELVELIESADWPLWAHRFRPVKTTDISIFTKMLAPTPKERVPA